MTEPRTGPAARWGVFIRERFPPARHAVMIVAFFAGNWLVAGTFFDSDRGVSVVLCAFAATFLTFFRLRVFDEIKDYRTDLAIHPERPLARGVLSLREARTGAATCAALEGALALSCGAPAFLAWLAVLGYSLLMYREFFAGSWLRPRMELYAVTHTLVSGWMGIFVASAAGDVAPAGLPAAAWVFALANWCVFNVFEFARKTWSPEEERNGVESYSRRLRPWGAAALSLGMALGAWAAGLHVAALAGVRPQAAIAITPMLALAAAGSLLYTLKPARATSRVFRGAMLLYQVGFYVAAAVAFSREWRI